MKKINWGIIGLGNIANTFASAFYNSKNSKLLGISSKSSKKLNMFKEKHDISNEYCFESYQDLLNCDKIDIIYIALPHSFHFEWVVKCIESNKNILVEKPATINFEEMKKIIEKLKNTKLFFSEAFMYLHHPQTQKLINLIKEDSIGELISMESNFGFNIVEKKFLGFKWNKLNKKKRLFNKSLGGGSILDLGCYPSSFSILMAKLKSETDLDKLKIKNVKKDFGSIDVDLEAYAELHFNNDFTSKINCSFKKNLGQSTKLIGTNGEIFVENTWTCNPVKITLNGNNYDDFDHNFNNLYSYEIEKVSECLLNNREDSIYPSMNRYETLENMKILNKWMEID